MIFLYWNLMTILQTFCQNVFVQVQKDKLKHNLLLVQERKWWCLRLTSLCATFYWRKRSCVYICQPQLEPGMECYVLFRECQWSSHQKYYLSSRWIWVWLLKVQDWSTAVCPILALASYIYSLQDMFTLKFTYLVTERAKMLEKISANL